MTNEVYSKRGSKHSQPLCNMEQLKLNAFAIRKPFIGTARKNNEERKRKEEEKRRYLFQGTKEYFQ